MGFKDGESGSDDGGKLVFATTTILEARTTAFNNVLLHFCLGNEVVDPSVVIGQSAVYCLHLHFYQMGCQSVSTSRTDNQPIVNNCLWVEMENAKMKLNHRNI